jgi:hypothetical protein
MGIVVRCKYNYGQIVYIKTDTAQDPRQVIGVQGTADGGMLIRVTIDGESSWHYECELSDEKDIMLAMNN